jgi:hypothetical protein
MYDIRNANLRNYIAGKHAPIQKWLYLGQPLEPCMHVQMSLPMYSFDDCLAEQPRKHPASVTATESRQGAA